MKKSEMFDIVVDKVCEVCEVRRDSVMNGNKCQAVVDARVLAVQYLRRIGLSSDDIALIALRKSSVDPEYTPTLQDIKKKAKSVDKMFQSYSERCLQSYAFRYMSVEIRDFCRTRYNDLLALEVAEFSK